VYRVVQRKRKDVNLCITLDRQAANILYDLAEREFDGNRSQAVRRLIRDFAQANEEKRVKYPEVAS
jgi:hypothetical protein